jgi:hypothetical protein
MTAPVPQAAVDAAMKAMACHRLQLTTRLGVAEVVCRKHNEYTPDFQTILKGEWTDHGCPEAVRVAAAVVAAVQGPIKAEADPVIEYLDRLERMDPSPRMKAIIAELRAEHIEAQ